METLVANLGAARRVVDSHGTWLVAPMTLIVPGVLDGSKGPLYYPADEVARNHKQWEGYPLTRNHPARDGLPASAFDTGVLDRVGMGVVRNPSIVDNKLVAEGWFHETRTKQVDAAIWNALVEGRQIELSTGLGTENEVRNGHCPVTKRGYTAIARNYKPDHVAILTDGQRGACSINDGCGVHNVGWMDWIANAIGIKSITTGRFKPTGSGTGKGEIHEAAQAGHLTFTDADRELGATVRNDLSVIADEATWQRAKDAAGKAYSEDDDAHWSAAAAIYQRMGGAVRNEADVQLCQLANAFCATGDGGGQDNSCGGEGGGGSPKSPGSHAKGLKDRGYSDMDLSYEDVSHDVNKHFGSLGKDELKDAAKEFGLHVIPTSKKATIAKIVESIHDSMAKGDRGNVIAREAGNQNAPYRREGLSKDRQTQNQQETIMNRDQAINHLTTNCDCWKGKKELLTNKTHFTDEDITKLMTNFQAGQLAVNSLKEIGQAVGAPATLTINAMPAFVKEKVAMAAPAAAKCPECGAAMADGKCPECGYGTAKEEPVVGNKKRTTEQWLADAPPEAREMLNGLIANERSAKSELISKLVANAKPGAKERLQKSLASKTVIELRDLVSILPTNNRHQQDDDTLTNYFGAAGSSNDVIVDNTIAQDGVEYAGPWPGVVRMNATA